MFKKLLVLSLSLFTLASCTNEGNNSSSTTDSTTTDSTTTDSSTQNSYTRKQSFSYTFKNGDFANDKNTLTKNGLTINYTNATYFGYNSLETKGIQIGSSKNPEKDFNLNINFNENVVLNDYNLELSVASSGNATYNINYNQTNETNNFNNVDPKNYNKLNINQETNNLNIKLSAIEKAMYLKSISFSILTKEDSKLNLEADKPTISEGTIKPGENSVPNINYQTVTKEQYYQTFDLKLEGEALRKELDTKNELKTKVSYGDARYMLIYTDESIKEEGNLYGIYDDATLKANWDQGATWNREHVWACSHMTINGDSRPNNSTMNHMSDLHNLRVSTTSINSARGNDYFGNNEGGDIFFPNKKNDDHRGDVARILFYMYSNYNFLLLNDNPNNNSSVSMGILSDLLKWHNEDPVDEFELRRNERIYQYQGNRNPFIDYPNLVNQLF